VAVAVIIPTLIPLMSLARISTGSWGPVGYGIRAIADRAFEAAGFTRRVVAEITNLAEGANYVRHGLGIALLPQFIPVRDDLARITVTGADLNWRMSLAVPAGRAPSAAARALIAMIEATATPAAGFTWPE
jgi:DNA-binding transcriptional LysR family regulator